MNPLHIRQYHVFLASPGDVGVERSAVRRFFDDYNRHTAHLWNARFEVVDWENYATIGVGRPQELITRQTLEKYRDSLALVIGIMGQRFGSPTGKAESGTEEEFHWAIESHIASGFPEIKWFFRKVDKLELPADPDEADAALDQWKKVRGFRKRMQDLNNPVFYAEYPHAAAFTEILTRDLNLWLNDPLRPWAAELASRTAVAGASVALPVEFDAERYGTALLKRFDKLNFEMLDTTGLYYQNIRLWSVFVPQSVRECHQYNPRLLEIPKEHQKRLLDAGEITAKELEEAEQQEDRQRQNYFRQPLRPALEIVDEALRASVAGAGRRLVILGDPGSGKSSLIRYLALRWAGVTESAVRDAQPIPMVIDLGAYARWECAGQKNFVRFLEEASGWHDWPRGLLARLLEQPRRVVLLLDGLDEVFEAARRELVVNDIVRFSNLHPGVSMVVTSRVVGYQAQRLRDAEFSHFMLQDLEATQITEFVERWHAVTIDDPALAAPKRDRLQKAIRESRSIALLAGNPLLLTMMAILNRNQELPRDRADLYAQASRVLLHQWDTERALSGFPGMSTEIGLREKTDILRRIAAHMQAAPGGLKGNLIDGVTLEGLIEDYLRDELHVDQARAAARAVVDQLRQRNFILCFVGADSYAFVHRTFLEYFCAADFVHQFNIARTLNNDGLIALFDQHCREDEWREVLRLICGQIDDPFIGQVVTHLAKHADLEHWDGKATLPELPLAIWCLGEARNPSRIEEAGASLLETVTNCFLMGERPQEPFILDLISAAREIGSRWPGKTVFEFSGQCPESVEFFHHWRWPHLLSAVFEQRSWIEQLSECHKPVVRRGAIEVLAEKWPDQTARELLTQRAVQDDNFSPRGVALRALAETWPDQTTRELLTQRAVQDDNYYTRGVALELLAQKWPDQTTRELLTQRAVQDDHFDPRSAALRALAEKWPDQTTRELLTQRAVQDDNNDPRGVALQALADKWPDQTTREFLTQRALQDDRSDTRGVALELLAGKWPDQTTRELLTQRALQDDRSDTRSVALRVLAEKWPDQTTRDLLTQRAVHDSHPAARGMSAFLIDKSHSRFSRILLTRDLDGIGPYLDPLEPVTRAHIEKAAKKAGVVPSDIDAQVASLSTHLGWDITVGAKPPSPQQATQSKPRRKPSR